VPLRVGRLVGLSVVRLWEGRLGNEMWVEFKVKYINECNVE